MLYSHDYNLSFFPLTGPAPQAMSAGLRFGAQGTHTSRTMMFEELQEVFGVTKSDAKREDYAFAIIEANCLAKPTAATRRLTNQRLGELHGLDPSIPLFRVLRRLWDIEPDGHRLLALLTAIARDPLLAASALAIIFLPINADFQRDSMKASLQRFVGCRLGESTLDKVCRNAASTWTQSGHLEGRTFKRRRSVQATPAVLAYAMYLAHAAGFRGSEIFSSAWVRVLDCEPSTARQLALEAKRAGLIDLLISGDVVELNLTRLDPMTAKG